MRRLLLAVVALSLVFGTAPASAVSPETQADFDRAAAYWNATPICVDEVTVIVDQAKVAPNAALGQQGTCNIWVGDFYLSTSPARRCAIIVHEWGHLIGHTHEAGLADDPLGVMVSDSMPGSCAEMDPPAPAPVPAPPAVVAPRDNSAATTAWTAYNATYVRWAEHRQARADCKADANSLKRRAARVAARRRCVRRLGVIRRGPVRPAMPNPAWTR